MRTRHARRLREYSVACISSGSPAHLAGNSPSRRPTRDPLDWRHVALRVTDVVARIWISLTWERVEGKRKGMAEVRILPVVQRDGSAVRGLSAQVQSIDVYQIVGGPRNAERGSREELAQALQRGGISHQEGSQEVILAETGEVVPPQTLPLPLAFDTLKALERLAQDRGVSATELLQGLVADLTGTLGHHGEEERRYARHWIGHVRWPKKPANIAAQ